MHNRVVLPRVQQLFRVPPPCLLSTALFRFATFCFLILATGLWNAPSSSAALRMTELLAENDGGLRDADGDSPDWIELSNDGASAMNLAGWHLTDSPDHLSKWTFPATNLESGRLLVIFASGKDRAVAGGELHTNFRLEQNGGYLALVEPDGATIVQALTYPKQRVNVSFGFGRQVASTLLLAAGASARVYVPSNGALGLAWTARAFDDSGWLVTNTPLAYNLGGVASPLLSIDFNVRGQDPTGTTQPGFQSFIINSNISTVTIQTQATTRVYGGLSVSVSNSAPNGYDDRLRTPNPPNSGAFTESLLLRDFVFSRDLNGSGGLDVTVAGLGPGKLHRVTVWSFDSGSAGTRVSDWFANGVTVTNNYTFNGQALPTSNTQYRFTFDSTSDASGRIAISGRRDASSVDGAGVASFGVYLNAVQVSTLDFTEPGTGLAGLMFGHNATALVRVPFVGMGVGAEYDLLDSHLNFLVTAHTPVIRGGVIRPGGTLRAAPPTRGTACPRRRRSS